MRQAHLIVLCRASPQHQANVLRIHVHSEHSFVDARPSSIFACALMRLSDYPLPTTGNKQSTITKVAGQPKNWRTITSAFLHHGAIATRLKKMMRRHLATAKHLAKFFRQMHTCTHACTHARTHAHVDPLMCTSRSQAERQRTR